MLLTIDVGNTRIKWGVFDQSGTLTETGACLHQALSSINFPQADKIMISAVATPAIVSSLESKLNNHQEIHYARPASHYKDLNNTYTNIEQLGIDRWMAAVACWHTLQDDCLIVNAGTAITIDAIQTHTNGANYLGGWIVPGLTLMQKSLAQNTAQLTISNANHPFTQKNAMLGFGLDTQSAIKNGTIASAVGAISIAYQQLCKTAGKPVSVMISGGDAQAIAQQCHQLGIAAETDEHLVLKGLYATTRQASV